MNLATTVFRGLQNIEPSVRILFFFRRIVQLLETLIKTNVFFAVPATSKILGISEGWETFVWS